LSSPFDVKSQFDFSRLNVACEVEVMRPMDAGREQWQVITGMGLPLVRAGMALTVFGAGQAHGLGNIFGGNTRLTVAFAMGWFSR